MCHIPTVSQSCQETSDDSCYPLRSSIPLATIPSYLRALLFKCDKLSLGTTVLTTVILSGYHAFSRNNAYWGKIIDSWGFTIGPWIALFGITCLVAAWLAKDNYKQDGWSWGVPGLRTIDLYNGVAPLIEARRPWREPRRRKVRSAMRIVPKPSVRMRVRLMSSCPVMATPMS